MYNGQWGRMALGERVKQLSNTEGDRQTDRQSVRGTDRFTPDFIVFFTHSLNLFIFNFLPKFSFQWQTDSQRRTNVLPEDSHTCLHLKLNPFLETPILASQVHNKSRPRIWFLRLEERNSNKSKIHRNYHSMAFNFSLSFPVLWVSQTARLLFNLSRIRDRDSLSSSSSSFSAPLTLLHVGLSTSKQSKENLSQYNPETALLVLACLLVVVVKGWKNKFIGIKYEGGLSFTCGWRSPPKFDSLAKTSNW